MITSSVTKLPRKPLLSLIGCFDRSSSAKFAANASSLSKVGGYPFEFCLEALVASNGESRTCYHTVLLQMILDAALIFAGDMNKAAALVVKRLGNPGTQVSCGRALHYTALLLWNRYCDTGGSGFILVFLIPSYGRTGEMGNFNFNL